jgi:chemotaxis protein methyltransferase CheR
VSTLLRDLIQERIGIFFDDDRLGDLIEKLTPMVQKLNCYSYLDYYYLLKYEPNNEKAWDEVMEALSVQETYFWREMTQLNALIQEVIPKWFEKSNRPLKIWSAAAATGEEPFGIAIAILEAGFGHLPIQIYASDCSVSALEKAARRQFRENSFRMFPLQLRRKYFTKEGTLWKLNDEAASRVQLRRANLMAPAEINDLARSHVIFCRNVFIYFSAYSIRLAIATLATRMPKHGLLFLGASESLLRLTTDFELREIGGAFAYVRI